MRFRWAVALLISLGFPLAACAPSDDGSSSTPATALPLVDSRWVLDEFLPAGEDALLAVPDAVSATAAFSAEQITGDAGCNRFTGAYSTNGPAIAIGPVAATLMACPPEVAEVEDSYLARLADATAYAIADDVLTMRAADGSVVLRFSAAPPVTLTGTKWRATGINNGKGGVTAPIEGTTVDAVFEKYRSGNRDFGNLTGNAGCNRYAGPYSIDGDQLKTGELATTRRTCAPEVNEQEQLFLAAMSATRAYTLTERTLELRDGSGALQLSFTAP